MGSFALLRMTVLPSSSASSRAILLLSSARMRAAAILGLGCSPKDLKPFQTDNSVQWQIGMPAERDEVDVVVLFGGDGTIHRHLGQLVKLGLPVLVVPSGSGNDFARALGLRRVRDSLAAWKSFCRGSSNIREIDLGVIAAVGKAGEAPAPHEQFSNKQYFCCVAGVGLDGEVARRANGLPRWLRGNGGYVLSLVPTIFTFTPFPTKILGATSKGSPSDGWTIRFQQSALLAAFANTPVYGGGMKVAPKARMDDGLLDACVVGALSPFKLFCLFPTVYGGNHLTIDKVEYFQESRLHVETEQPLDVYADGEYVCQTPVEIAVERAALKVIVGGS
jgi:diacylglycerol kinase (ATP)